MREHRETATAAMDQVILHLVGNIPCGRAEETTFFHKDFALCAKSL
jgi:hypothetical protein